MTKQTKKLLINIAVLVLLVGVTLLTLLLNYKELNFQNIFAFLKRCKAWCIVAAVGCMFLVIGFEALAIYVIARSLGHRSKPHQSLAYASADAYYSAITPSASGGQPASLYYMMRDGMNGGTAGFTLIFNLMAYTAAFIFIALFAFIARPSFFGSLGSGFAQTLVIVGVVIQAVLLGFFLLCLFWSKGLLKLGNGVIRLGTKMKLVKNPEKWQKKWAGAVEKYSSCRRFMSTHPFIVIVTFVLNLCQRVALSLIPCFICFGASAEASFIDLFAMQSYVLLGYASIPIPGGVGAYEYMYLRMYGAFYDDAFILSAMMVSRVISYYLCMIVSGLYVIVYHSLGIKGKKKVQAEAVPEGIGETSATEEEKGEDPISLDDPSHEGEGNG